MKQYRVRERLHENLSKHLMLARGIKEEGFTEFLEPDFVRDSHDPFLLPDMEQAVERILCAQKNNEKVAVWSDYDCDGIPGGVMLAQFLTDIGIAVRHYIPHRHTEGYGLNNEGLAELAAEGVTLVITVDLGTSDIGAVAYARSKGVDIIVTDHHLCPEQLPNALIINPKRKDSRYPFDGLCGAGVAWKLVQAILSKNRPEGFAEGREKWFLDLVGIATLSDRVPLVGENRMLAHFGLAVMRRNRRPGLAALLKLLRIAPSALTEDDVGFMLGPRINAASRMGSPEVAAQLLRASDAAEATQHAKELQKLNDERKGVVAATVKEVNKRLAQGVASPLIVMGNPNWRPGVLGLVASNLVEAHGKPVFLWGREGGEILRGSCRSAGALNIVELMEGARDMFGDFGGHRSSGGFSVREEHVHGLSTHLLRAYEQLGAREVAEEETIIDRELSLAEVPFARRDLARLAPFGEGNPKPLFLFSGVEVASIRAFGKAGDHQEFMLSREGSSVSGVSFFSSRQTFNKPPVVGERADIVGHVESDWRGHPRIRVVDIL